jgi:hypothetical protein
MWIMGKPFGSRLNPSSIRRHADTDAEVPAKGESGGVTYGDTVRIGPEGSTDPQTAPQTTENAVPARQGQ